MNNSPKETSTTGSLSQLGRSLVGGIRRKRGGDVTLSPNTPHRRANRAHAGLFPILGPARPGLRYFTIRSMLAVESAKRRKLSSGATATPKVTL